MSDYYEEEENNSLAPDIIFLLALAVLIFTAGMLLGVAINPC